MKGGKASSDVLLGLTESYVPIFNIHVKYAFNAFYEQVL
jgi:hypothetical protein